MKTLGFDEPLYILPFDHRGLFQKRMFGSDGVLSPQQTEEIAAAKRVITGDATVAEIARRYQEFVEIFESREKVVSV